MTRSFTIFLEEGYHQRPEAAALPRLVSQAIAGGIFEIVQREVAAGRTAELPRLLPQLTYIAIAPFLRPETRSLCCARRSRRRKRRSRRSASPRRIVPGLFTGVCEAKFAG